MDYKVAFTLYSADGKREAEVRELRNGEAYLFEREWSEKEAAFKERHEGRWVGPFDSPKSAEKFIITTAWFRGSEK